MRRQRAVRTLLACAVVLLACSKPEDPCSADNQKTATANLVASWYLYLDLLPASVDLGAYHDPSDLLDALTKSARDAGKDRFWSYTSTVAAQQQFFAEGTTVGFGLGLLIRGSQLFVAQVYPNSAASVAFKRGDEIVAIGAAKPLTLVSTLIAGKTLDEANLAVGDAFGPATVGLQRLFAVIPAGGSTPEERSMTKATYALDPVPPPRIIDRSAQNLPKAGYVALRTFITPAEPLLTAAFDTFQKEGVKDLIVDLRYDGGGQLFTADVFANLLGGGLSGETMFELGYNTHHPEANGIAAFVPVAQSLTPDHVAFLVTGASASASELLPNALAPFRSVALVGHQTYGKPVGQQGFVDQQCGLVVYLVSFRLKNSAGIGDYFGGLPYPGFPGCAVPADDDLTHEPGDVLETQTAAALQWFTDVRLSGTCPPPPVGPLSVSEAGRLPDAYPRATHPSEAQRHVQGLF